MNKLIICTVGTSIATQCPAQKEMSMQPNDWDSDAEPLRSQIIEFLKKTGNNPETAAGQKSISAEMNTLGHLDVKNTDRIVLLASDNAQGRICAEMNERVIISAFGLSNAQVETHRIEGLQVHNAKLLRELGLKNLVKIVVDKYLSNENIRHNYDIIINPTGGFKGVVPFLTILGMLYGRRTVYMFEFSDELITLPPLPFSFDMQLYERVRPAIAFIEKEVAVPEDAFLKKIKNYSPSERDLFMAFTEPYDSNFITLSPLAYCLLSSENGDEKPLLAEAAIEMLKKIEDVPLKKVKRLIKNSVNPFWREKHYDPWFATDLMVLKQNDTAERIAGFLKNGGFCITHVFGNHDNYQRILGNYKVKDFVNKKFIEWEDVDKEDSSFDDLDSDAILTERDELFVENKGLKRDLHTLREDLENLKLANAELVEKLTDTEKQVLEKDTEIGKLEGIVKVHAESAAETVYQTSPAPEKETKEKNTKTFFSRFFSRSN